ncbi:MAG: ABC transporter permease subunit [Anaerolineae bacterium]|jgi:peptide/nickel transport system permease protein
MAKFIVRRLLLMLLTMVLVSVAVFVITEAAPGNVARNVLGIQITPEQEASFLDQNGLDEPLYDRYFSWLFGTDWRASNKIDMSLRRITTEDGFKEWWAVDEDGTLVRWQLEGEDLIARRRQPDGSVEETIDNGRWRVKDPQVEMERLQAYREELVANDQLLEEDRQAILEQLDRILGILDTEEGEAALSAALAGPEGALEAMVDADVAQRADELEEAADEILQKSQVSRLIEVYETLSSEAADDLELSQFQTMARQLDTAAKAIEDADPSLAETVRQTAEQLRAGESQAASQSLAGVVEALDGMTGSLARFAPALKARRYQAAAGYLADLSDPALVPLGDAQLALMPDLVQTIGDALEDASEPLSKNLLQAAESLEAGDAEGVRAPLGGAAEVLSDMGYAIASSDAAREARVIRTFWGVDTQDHAVLWEKGGGDETWVFIVGTGWMAISGGPTEYIPLQKGLLRADPGKSLRTGRPVSDLLFKRLRNSLVLAGIAFVLVMPLALVLGLLAGLREGKPLDRVLSIGGMMFSVTPEFATGIFLILIFAFWLKLVPGATVFGEDAPWTRPDMLVLPVSTLTLIELGYVLRITRASMVDVMKAPYIRTAFLKGLPYRRVVTKHAIRNALMAPITVIMLHVNWLLGGIVVVEVIFGYPGLGSYLLDSALFKDFNAIEAGAIILVAVAVGTQLLADVIYTFLNPRIRYG